MDIWKTIREKTAYFGYVGIILVLIGALVVNISLDNARTAAITNIDALSADLESVDTIVQISNNQFDRLNSSLYEFKGSFAKAKEAVMISANASERMGDAILKIGLIGMVVGSQVSDIKKSANLLRESVTQMEEALGEMENQTKDLEVIKGEMVKIKNSIADQRESLGETKNLIDGSIFSLRIGIFLFMLALIGIFMMFIANSRT